MNGSPGSTVQATDMVTLYAGHAVKVWVEDTTSRAYLQECWTDPQIGFLIAGQKEGVLRAVESAKQDGFAHVFGVVDKDFESSNRPRWFQSGASPVFRPDVHEIENYLLNPNHLVACDLNTEKRTEPQIAARLNAMASQMLWRIACREILSNLRHQILKDFPSHSMVDTHQAALDHIVQSNWYQQLAVAIPTWTTTHIENLLTTAHQKAQTTLNNGSFLTEFSGKEMLRDLHSWLYKPPRGSNSSPSELDQDLARSVARFQVANNFVPAEVIELRSAIRHE